MLVGTLFIATIWAYFLAIAFASSPRSPRDRKTKSPGTLGSPVAMEIASPRSSPRFKRKKTVTITDQVSFHEDYDVDDVYRDISHVELSDNTNTLKLISTEDAESPQSVTAPLTIRIPRPILKIRVINKAHPTSMHLFKFGTIADVKAYYDRGVQLALGESVLHEIFKHLFETGQFGKLKVIFDRDRLKLIDFILLNEELAPEAILALSSHVFPKSEEYIQLILEETIRCQSTMVLRVTFYMLAINYESQDVYNILNSLLESSEKAPIAREILNQYNRRQGTTPILIFSLQKGLEFKTILSFEPSEIDRLDSGYCSVIYHAACEGNLEALEFFKTQMIAREVLSQYNSEQNILPILVFLLQKGLKFGSIFDFEPSAMDCLAAELFYHESCEGSVDTLEFFKPLNLDIKFAGICPLIGAAIKDRDDSLEFFLNNDDCFRFSEEDYVEAAFTAAFYNNFTIFRLLYATGKVNLYSYRGDSTFLSVALKRKNFGFANLLIDRYKYDVNFVGEDPINPKGNALTFVLNYPSIVETLLKNGANRNIKVYIQEEEDTEESLVSLNEYLEICKDPKLVKIFNKYPTPFP